MLGNPESTTWNPEFKAVSVFPYMRGEFYFNFCIKHSFWSMNLKVQRHNLVVLVQWRIKGRGWEVPVPPLSQGLDDRPRPPPPPRPYAYLKLWVRLCSRIYYFTFNNSSFSAIDQSLLLSGKMQLMTWYFFFTLLMRIYPVHLASQMISKCSSSAIP